MVASLYFAPMTPRKSRQILNARSRKCRNTSPTDTSATEMSSPSSEAKRRILSHRKATVDQWYLATLVSRFQLKKLFAYKLTNHWHKLQSANFLFVYSMLPKIWTCNLIPWPPNKICIHWIYSLTVRACHIHLHLWFEILFQWDSHYCRGEFDRFPLCLTGETNLLLPLKLRPQKYLTITGRSTMFQVQKPMHVIFSPFDSQARTSQ